MRVVQPALEKRDTQFWCALPIKKRVVIALWRLPTGNSFRTVVKTFAVGKSTAVQITREFCSEMLHLAPGIFIFLEKEEKQPKLLNSSSFFANSEYLKYLEPYKIHVFQ